MSTAPAVVLVHGLASSFDLNWRRTGLADLLADAVCVKRGRELAFSEIRVHDPDDKPVATGTLVYRIAP